jgi:hypothetical protein
MADEGTIESDGYMRWHDLEVPESVDRSIRVTYAASLIHAEPFIDLGRQRAVGGSETDGNSRTSKEVALPLLTSQKEVAGQVGYVLGKCH